MSCTSPQEQDQKCTCLHRDQSPEGQGAQSIHRNQWNHYIHPPITINSDMEVTRGRYTFIAHQWGHEGNDVFDSEVTLGSQLIHYTI